MQHKDDLCTTRRFIIRSKVSQEESEVTLVAQPILRIDKASQNDSLHFDMLCMIDTNSL